MQYSRNEGRGSIPKNLISRLAKVRRARLIGCARVVRAARPAVAAQAAYVDESLMSRLSSMREFDWRDNVGVNKSSPNPRQSYELL